MATTDSPITADMSAQLAATGVRWLLPANVRFFPGEHGLLLCEVLGETACRAVFTVRMFPIRHPEQFISVRYNDAEDKEIEIGVIEKLADFPVEARELIRASLARHYHEKIVRRVRRVVYEHGLLFFRGDIEPDGRDREFILYWSYNSAEEYGESGKVLIDVYENRLIIPDMGQLPAADRRLFESFIYW